MALPFSKIATLLSECEDIETRDPPLLAKLKAAQLNAQIESWFKCNRDAISRLAVRPSSALLSTLLPERQIDRVYGIQSKTLCRILCRALGLSSSGTRDLEAHTKPGHSDLAQCLERVMNTRGPPAYPRVTLDEVDEMLEHLAGQSVFSGRKVPKTPATAGDQAQVVRNVLLRATPHEGRWIVRLILKDLSPVRLDEYGVLRSFHFLLPDLLRFQDDLDTAIRLLKGALVDFPCRPDVRSETLHRRQAATLVQPAVGVKVGRPEFYKARSPLNCLDMVSKRKWVLERKYDGEYCEVHVQVNRSTEPAEWITIFSKGGKDSTTDRKKLLVTLVECLRLGKADCRIQHRAILLGELVVCRGDDSQPLAFEKIRKHIPRSGRFLGTNEDSQVDPDEHLAIVFYDLLLLDKEIVMQRSIEERRNWLREMYRKKRGWVMGAEWRIVDFAEANAKKQLLTQFAASIARRCEGLVLKPCGVPYVMLGTHVKSYNNSYIKLKKDYMEGMGDEADFAVVGASYNAQRATNTGVPHLKWTDFHLACLLNKEDVQRFEDARPRFRVVDTISHSTCIPRAILRSLNTIGQFSGKDHKPGEQPVAFDIEGTNGLNIQVTFDMPMVVELLGSGFTKPANCAFFALRHARMRKLHEDRSWKSTVSFQELQEQAQKSRAPPDDSESQETRRRVVVLEQKCRRKFGRDQTVTPKSRTTASQSTTVSPSRSRKREGASTAALVAADKFQLSSARSSSHMSRLVGVPIERSRADNKRPFEGVEALNASRKRPKHNSTLLVGATSAQVHSSANGLVKFRSLPTYRTSSTSTSFPMPLPREFGAQTRFSIKGNGLVTSSALTDITNTVKTGRGRSSSQSPLHPTSKTSKEYVSSSVGPSSRSNTPPSSPPPRYAMAANHQTSCEANHCLFANTVVYLDPDIASRPSITATLDIHHILRVPSISFWDRDSFAHEPHCATVSESQAYPDKRKIVLADRHRVASLRQIERDVAALNGGAFRERIEVWDWRVLDQADCAAHSLPRSSAVKHFLGATIFDPGKGKAILVKAP